MADVAQCIDKLATASKISRKIADEELDYAAPVKAESPLTDPCIYFRL
jgi:hypothetical protein